MCFGAQALLPARPSARWSGAQGLLLGRPPTRPRAGPAAPPPPACCASVVGGIAACGCGALGGARAEGASRRAGAGPLGARAWARKPGRVEAGRASIRPSRCPISVISAAIDRRWRPHDSSMTFSRRIKPIFYGFLMSKCSVIFP